MVIRKWLHVFVTQLASAEEYALVQERVLATANTTYRQLGELRKSILSMAGGMKSLGYQELPRDARFR